MERRLCYISRNYKSVRSGGGRAKTDVEAILSRLGGVNLGLHQSHHPSMVTDFALTLSGVVKAMLSIRRGDVLVLQYPVKKYYETLCDAAHLRGAMVVTLIHDLGSFRRKKLSAQRETRRLDHSDVIIALNDNMLHLLEGYGCRARMTTLGIWDYLSPPDIPSIPPRQGMEPADGAWSVMYIGSAAPDQNAFLYDLGARLRHSRIWHFGGGYDATLAQERLAQAGRSEGRLMPQGYRNDYDLMRQPMGDFGLSWYGESLTDGVGKIGEYMPYNNPHKVSLYLRCGLPLIIWRKAGLAPFVEREGCGLVVDSLEGLDEQLAAVTPADYARMRAAVERVAQRIAEGRNVSEAIERALALLP